MPWQHNQELGLLSLRLHLAYYYCLSKSGHYHQIDKSSPSVVHILFHSYSSKSLSFHHSVGEFGRFQLSGAAHLIDSNP